MGLPLRNRSPEYEWDIPLRNGIIQWEGPDLPFENAFIGNKDTYTYSVIRV
jgi:hypothetical protein